MGEENQYINTYLNSKSNALSFYVYAYLNAEENTEMQSFYLGKILMLISDLNKLLKKFEVVSPNKFFNLLLLLKDYEIPQINDLLNKYHYSQILDNYYQEALKQIHSDIIPEGIYRQTIEYYITNHKLNYEDQLIIYEFYIKQILLKNKPIDYEIFEIIMKEYAKRLASSYGLSINISLDDASTADTNTYYLAKEDLQKMYTTGFFHSLKSIFYLLRLSMQDYDIYLNGEKAMLTIIKDKVLMTINPNYYEENNGIMYYQIDAEIFSITKLLELFTKFGINFKDNQNPYEETLNSLKKQLDNLERNINGELVSINDIFASYIMFHPEILEIYPPLRKEYIVNENNLVIKKAENGGRK